MQQISPNLQEKTGRRWNMYTTFSNQKSLKIKLLKDDP